jgi:hypothetical protein
MTKTRSGENLDCIYRTSWGEKVACPDSELAFYVLIGQLRQSGMITSMQHLSAERHLFFRGFKRVC